MNHCLARTTRGFSTLLASPLAALVATFAVTLVSACGDAGPRPLGATCDDDSQCTSGLCAAGKCLDPIEDDDNDSLSNGLEAQLGSNPLEADTDGDGTPDGEEIAGIGNVDSDEDGKADIVESSTTDGDGDCITDQYDAHDDDADTDLSPMIPVVCSHVGVCSATNAAFRVTCPSGTAVCIYDDVAGFADPEVLCDGKDDNCNGTSDEGFATDDDEDGIADACTSRYHLSFAAIPETIVAGQPFDLDVVLLDARDVVVASFAGQLTLTLEGGLANELTIGDITREAGVITIHDVTLQSAGSGRVLVASAGAFEVRSEPIDVSHSGALALAFEAPPTSAVVGVPFDVAFVVQDDLGNTASDFAGTITLTADDPDATLPEPLTLAAAHHGRGTFFGVRLAHAGTANLTVSADSVGVTSASTPVNVTAGQATTIRIESLAASTAAGEALTFTVSARDAAGNVVPEYTGTVSITTSDDGATVPASHTFGAGDQGLFEFSGLVLVTAGMVTVTATDDAEHQAEAIVTVDPGAAASFEVALADDSVPAGVATSAVVTARDAYANRAVGFTGAVALTSSDALATLPTGVTFEAADTGRKVVNNLILRSQGPQTVTVTAVANETLMGSDGITVTPGADTVLIITGLPASTPSGTSLGFTLEAQDAEGNPKPSYTGTVHFTTTDGTATVPGDYTFTAGDNGSHAFTGLVLRTAQDTVVRATDTATAAITTSTIVTVTAGARDHFTLACSPDPVAAGGNVSCTVTAIDAAGNVASGYTGTLTVTSSDANATLPASVVMAAADQGTKTATGLVLKTAGAQTITFADSAKTVQDGVTVNPIAASSIDLTGLAASSAVGVAQTLTATLRDTYGNRATGFIGAGALSSNDPDADFVPTSLTFDAAAQGQRTFTVTFANGGDHTVTVDAGGALQVTRSTTVTGGGRHMVLSGLPATVTAGAPQTVTITIQDGAGATVTNFVGTVALTVGGGSATPPSVTFNGTGGTRTSSVTFTAAGTRTLQAQNVDLGSTSVNVDVVPGAPTTAAWTTQPGNGTANAALGAAVIALRDAYGNPVTTGPVHNVTFRIGRNPSQARITGALTTTTVAGIATLAAGAKIDRAGLDFELVADIAGVGSASSAPFDIAWSAPVVTGVTVGQPAGPCAMITFTVAQADSVPVDVDVEIATGSPTTPFQSLLLGAYGEGTRGLATSPTGVEHTVVYNASGASGISVFVFAPGALRVSAFAGSSVGRGTSSAPVTVESVGQPYATLSPTALDAPFDIAAADVDGDGRKEIVVANDGNRFAIYRWNSDDTLGENTFQLPVPEVTPRIKAMAIGQFADDPGEEIALLDPRNDIVWIISAGGDVMDYHSVGCGGPTDIATAHLGGESDAIVITCRNAGESSFNAIVRSGGEWNSIAGDILDSDAGDTVTASDLDHDGFDDLIFGGQAGIEVWTTDDGGFPSFAQRFDTPAQVAETVVNDLNQDDYPDVAVRYTDGSGEIYQGDGVGPFDTTRHVFDELYAGNLYTNLSIGDADGDRLPDFLVVHDDAPEVLARRASNGGSVDNFRTTLYYPPGVDFRAVDVAAIRLAEDARDAFALIYFDSSNDRFQLAIWRMTSRICQIDEIGPQDAPIAADPLQVVTRDFDHDGWLDVMGVSAGTVDVALGRGDTGFRDSNVAVPVIGTVQTLGAAVGDLDGDGLDDVAMLRQGANDVWLSAGEESEGGVAFTNAAVIANVGTILGVEPRLIAVGDVDGDRRDDLVLADEDGAVHFLYQGAGGTFSAGAHEVVASEGQVTSLTLDDVDVDGVLDAITVAGGHQVCLIMGTAARAHDAHCIEGNVDPDSLGTDPIAVGPVLADIDGLPGRELVYALRRADGGYPSALVTWSASVPETAGFDSLTNVEACADVQRLALGEFGGVTGGAPSDRLDAAVTCGGTGNIEIFTRGPGEAFSATRTTSTFVGDVLDRSLVAGDFDGDGFDDLMMDGTVFGVRGATLASDVMQVNGLATDRVDVIVPFDANGDGDEDYAVVGSSTFDTGDGDITEVTIELSRGLSLGGLGGWTYDAVYPSSEGVVVRAAPGDFDGDGRDDLAVYAGVSSSRNELRMILRDHAGGVGLDPQGDYYRPSVGLMPIDVATGDVDRDGLDDVAVVGTNGSGQVEVRLVNSSRDGAPWVYRPSAAMTTLPDVARQILVGEFDPSVPGLELMVIGYCSGQAIGCAATINAAGCSPQSPNCLVEQETFDGLIGEGNHYDFVHGVVVDHDRDGLDDVVMAMSYDDLGTTRYDLMLMWQYGTGQFFAASVYQIDDLSEPVFGVGDVDGDDRPDVVAPQLGANGRRSFVAALANGLHWLMGSAPISDGLIDVQVRTRAGGQRPQVLGIEPYAMHVLYQRSP